MSSIKAAIATISLLLLALVCYIFYSFGDDYRISLAFNAFSKGEYAEAASILDNTSSDKATIALYNGYIARDSGNLYSSNQFFDTAISSKEADPLIIFEATLNKSLNSFFLHDAEKMQLSINQAHEANPHSPWIPLLSSLQQNLLNHIPDKSFSVKEILAWPPLSPWMEKTVKSTFTPFWHSTTQGRIEIAKGNYTQARGYLEDALASANDPQRDELDLLIATSFIKEGEQKPPETASAFYKLALPHLSRLPLDHQRFNIIRQQYADAYATEALSLMNHGKYNELPFFAYALDKFHEKESYRIFIEGMRLHIRSLIENTNTNIKNLHALTVILSRIPTAQQIRLSLSIELIARVKDALKNNNLSHAISYWDAAKMLNDDPQTLVDTFSKKISDMTFKKIKGDDDALTKSSPYIAFYTEIVKDADQRAHFSKALADIAMTRWEKEEKIKQGVLLLQLAAQIPYANDKHTINGDLQHRLQRQYLLAIKNDRYESLPYIIQTVHTLQLDDSFFQIDTLSQKAAYLSANKQQNKADQLLKWIRLLPSTKKDTYTPLMRTRIN